MVCLAKSTPAISTHSALESRTFAPRNLIQPSSRSSGLLLAIALIVAANAVGGLPYVGGYATNIIANLIAFLSAAVLVVSLKSLFQLAKD